MAKVSELKDRARGLEQQGDLAKAQAIYQHILKHLEGTPALKGELPLYVKVGDLALKQGDAGMAIVMYERAAEHYARAGSARSIGALVDKIRRADPTRDDEAVTLGRLLVAEGHPAAAAEVLARYATRIGRSDVVEHFKATAHHADVAEACERVESGISMLGHAPFDPTASAELVRPSTSEAAAPPTPAEREVRPTPAGSAVTPSMSDTLVPSAPADTPPVPTPPADLPLLIEHGSSHPEAASAPYAEPEPEPEPEP
ncbi:MAG: hypothetical protein OEY20_14710, partial [Gemmatimonadota bacterium]|nr:hypothetical protein [Gemmatimonadota bacterium]